MEKKKFTKPELKIVNMGVESVIATSGVDTPNQVGLANVNSTGVKAYVETGDNADLWK